VRRHRRPRLKNARCARRVGDESSHTSGRKADSAIVGLCFSCGSSRYTGTTPARTSTCARATQDGFLGRPLRRPFGRARSLQFCQHQPELPLGIVVYVAISLERIHGKSLPLDLLAESSQSHFWRLGHGLTLPHTSPCHLCFHKAR
jgi:hypothetical protein